MTKEKVGRLHITDKGISLEQEPLTMSAGLEKNIREHFASGDRVKVSFFEDGSVKAVILAE